jgi:poly(3-hydroxybutyrate) depolymerase
MRSGHLGGVMTYLLRDYRRLLPLALSILAGLFALAAMQGNARAQEVLRTAASETFVVPADDGYGTQDCLGKDKACGQVIASAWCEAHGLAAPIAYGPASDITGATNGAKPLKLDPNSFVITCRE